MLYGEWGKRFRKRSGPYISCNISEQESLIIEEIIPLLYFHSCLFSCSGCSSVLPGVRGIRTLFYCSVKYIQFSQTTLFDTFV